MTTQQNLFAVLTLTASRYLSDRGDGWTMLAREEGNGLDLWGGWEESDCGISGANFLVVFRSNYGSILLSFRDMTNWRYVALPVYTVSAT